MDRKLSALFLCLFTAASVVAAGAGSAKPVRPFNGKDLSGWKFDDRQRPQNWRVGRSELAENNPTMLVVKPLEEGQAPELIVAARQSQNIYTAQRFGDVKIELEVRLPAASNSGIYLMGEYELQVADDLIMDPKNPGKMDFGAISRVKAPKQLAHNPPGQWQKFEVVFRAPRFDENGEKLANAVFEKVLLNGKLIHDHTEVPESTYGCLTGRERPAGPLYLQGNEGPVAYRNIVITPLGDEEEERGKK